MIRKEFLHFFLFSQNIFLSFKEEGGGEGVSESHLVDFKFYSTGKYGTVEQALSFLINGDTLL